MKTNDGERLVRKPEKHTCHLVLNARDLPRQLAFDLTFETGSCVGNATSLALLRHFLAFTSIRRAGQRASGFCHGAVSRSLSGDLRIVTLLVTLRCRGIAGTGWTGVKILWVRQVWCAASQCGSMNDCLGRSVPACCWDIKQPTATTAATIHKLSSNRQIVARLGEVPLLLSVSHIQPTS